MCPTPVCLSLGGQRRKDVDKEETRRYTESPRRERAQNHDDTQTDTITDTGAGNPAAPLLVAILVLYD